jgi:metal-responsive CopG/Arc/MetJ family transcriptional regulator
MSDLAKLTVSIPKELIVLADDVAKAQKISRSKVVAHCLEELAKKRMESEMAEGYKAQADEHLSFARVAENAAREVAPEWK